jgi:hypothetical protein
MTRLVKAISVCWWLVMPSFAFAQAQLAPSLNVWLTGERLQKMLDAAAIEIPRLATYLLFLGLGWLIGKRLSVVWSREQKEREQDLDAARDFHALYGEFFSLWKLWNYFVRDLGQEALPGASRWNILDRACKSEARLESLLIKLASEKPLTDEEIEKLARFRQRYQHLREAIRDNVPLAWDHSEHPQYYDFKKLAPQVAAIIVRSDRARRDALIKITSNFYEEPDRETRRARIAMGANRSSSPS